MFDGWLSFGGTEIANRSRVMEYVKTLLPNLTLKDPCGSGCSCDHLADLLGEKRYATPLIDDAPWLDVDAPASYDFLGVFPTSIVGIDDSTVTAEVVESPDSGGWVVNRREATREIRVSVATFATSDEGAHYGTQWLKSVLDGSCDTATDDEPRDQLCYLTSCVDPADFTGITRDATHDLNDWTLYRSGWEAASTLVLREQESWAELSVPGSCGDVEWSLTLQGQEGNLIGIQQDGETQLFRLTGAPQVFTATTSGPSVRLLIPDVTGMASWGEPTEAEEAVGDESLWSHHTDDAAEIAGGSAMVWDQVTTIPLRVQILKVTSSARFQTLEDDCAGEFYRYIKRASNTEGVRFRRHEYPWGGGVITYLDFLITAEKPGIYGQAIPAVSGDSAILSSVALPFRVVKLSQNIPECIITEPPTLTDPLGPVTPPPPTQSTTGELTFRDQYLSGSSSQPYALIIPPEIVPAWLSVVPIIRLTAGTEDVRFAEVRFFPLPFAGSVAATDVDPCSACGSFEISYIPGGATFLFDGTEERATIKQGDVTSEAQHLVTAAGGKGALRWPILSCGIGYMVVIDTREQTLTNIEIELAVRE